MAVIAPVLVQFWMTDFSSYSRQQSEEMSEDTSSSGSRAYSSAMEPATPPTLMSPLTAAVFLLSAALPRAVMAASRMSMVCRFSLKRLHRMTA